jgi:hypothetical protein
MKRWFCLFAVLAGMGAMAPRPAMASWVGSNCSDDSTSDSHVRRADAQAYAIVGELEGYEWGGGCWNDNDKDDTPGAPDSNGEGPDCSGFTFKTWELNKTQGYSGFTYYNKLMNIHGPYTASEYHDVGQSTTWPFYRLKDKDRSTTLYMDAFASSVHIGMLFTSSDPGNGLDYIIEALGDAYGIDVNEEDYRSNTAYDAIRRKSWTADCYPHCSAASAPATVVMR